MSKVKHAEEFVYAAVVSEELEIDQDGSIWRIAIRRWDRWNKITRSIPCTKRRAERGVDYLSIRAMIDGKRMTALAHRLVWFHFKGPISGDLTVNHKNGIKSDNRPSNLELATDSEQMIHANRILGTGAGVNQTGERNPFAKVTTRQVAQIRSARSRGETCASIAARHGITYQQVWRIARGLSRRTG